MTRYVLAKLGQSIFVIWAAYSITFVLLWVLPYDTVDVMFDPNDTASVSLEQQDAVRESLGLNNSLVVQYFDRLFAAAHGDFGQSARTGEEAFSMVLRVLPQTLLLAASALVIAVVVAFAVALTAAFTRRRWLANAISVLPAAGVSVPVFLVGLVLLQIFSFQLRWFPPMGNTGISSLILPALTLAIPVSAPIAQLLLENITLGLQAPYVAVSAAKGGTRFWLLTREVLKNASLPALTIAGVVVGNLLAGAVIVETIFSRSGLGRLAESAVRTQDVPLVQAIVVFAALVFVVINFVVDIIYPLLDPRLKAEAGIATRRLERVEVAA